jgi:hypothetical protein
VVFRAKRQRNVEGLNLQLRWTAMHFCLEATPFPSELAVKMVELYYNLLAVPDALSLPPACRLSGNSMMSFCIF